jgi:hypothetical protein
MNIAMADMAPTLRIAVQWLRCLNLTSQNDLLVSDDVDKRVHAETVIQLGRAVLLLSARMNVE